MRFGVELEFTAALTGAICQTKGTFYDYLQHLANQCNIFDWKIEQDGSCGNEIVSPILEGEKGLAELLQMCHLSHKAAEDFGINRLTGVDCGIHFHYDATNLNHRQIRNSMVITAMAETLFYAMNPLSRFQTNFAAPLNFNLFQCIRARDVVDLRDCWFRSYMGVDAHPDSFRHKHSEYFPAFINNEKKNPQKYDWTRYHGFNFVSLFKNGTIEFRYAHGSFDEETVEHWFNLFLGVMKASVNLRTKDIMRTNFPFSMKTVKSQSLPALQINLYNNIGKVIAFLFKPKSGTKQSLIQPTVPMLQFIVERLVKFTPGVFTPKSYKTIMGESSDGDPYKVLNLILDNKLVLPHGGYVPMHNELIF